uniref:DNA/RNA-binding domain-containing protein n=1 Tax=Strigamia maritima TaxID=126957 RepID=T1JIJ0_STRMM
MSRLFLLRINLLIPFRFRQAEDLKEKVSGDILNDNEAWSSHQKLQQLYQQLLIMDLEYALDRKVEQDLWNYVFKNQINTLQHQAKDKKNPRQSESQGNLAWFLEAASGFYLQLLQELCDAFDLDLPCRRKGSVYGIIKGSKKVNCNITPPEKSSCFYVCQHCLVHLGDIARYRNQSLQAETFYRHAAQLVPSNGQPYNQLAILEAAKGEKLSMVFYYVRSIAVKHPFPVASTNLQKMFAKISGDDLNIEGKAKLSVYDYINTFLQFHGLVHMSSDLIRAEKLVKALSGNLSTLIATESLSSWKLIQMIAINLFAVFHSTHGFESQTNKQNMSEDEVKVYNLMLELLANVLNGILLLVYTMKDENSFKDYYALPVVKLILDWLQQDTDILKSQPFANKFQIWPSLCKLLNGIQVGSMNGFDFSKYQDVPLPEDWDLQCFLPLAKTHRQYKFKETTPRLTEEEEAKLRTYRLLSHGKWICEQEIAGRKLMTMHQTAEGDDKLLAFEAIIQEAPSSEVLLQLEEVSGYKGARNGHVMVESFGDSSSNSVGSQETSISHAPEETDKYNVVQDKTEKIKPVVQKENIRSSQNNARERKLRQNVAMQTILQKKYPTPKDEATDNCTLKPKIESKQVTFKTPSPSPPVSSDGTPPQTITPPQSINAHRTSVATYPTIPTVYPSLMVNNFGSQNQKISNTNLQTVDVKLNNGALHFPSNRMSLNYSANVENRNSATQEPISSTNPTNFTPPRMEFYSLPSSGPSFNSYTSQLPARTDFPQIPAQYQFKEPLKQTNNFMLPTQQQQQHIYGSNHPKLNYPLSDSTPGTFYNQQVHWYQQPQPAPTQTSLSLDQYFNPSPTDIASQASSLPPPPQLQALSPGAYHPIFPNPPSQVPSQNRNHLSENMVYQIQNPVSSLSFGCSAPLQLPLTKSESQTKITGTGSKTSSGQRAQVDCDGSGDVVGNTYSLFNSPWSSGLNPASTPSTTEVVSNQVPSNGSNFNSFMQPGLQSLWSGPGPSPLERLLEQQKQKRDTAPQ